MHLLLTGHSPSTDKRFAATIPKKPLQTSGFIHKTLVVNRRLKSALTKLKEICAHAPRDPYSLKKKVNRNRYFSEYILDTRMRTIKPLNSKTFYQSTEVNNFLGGEHRTFKAIPLSFLQIPFIKDLILSDSDLVKKINKNSQVEKWRLGIHIIENLATNEKMGIPTPEGIHRDGHDFIAMHYLGGDFEKGGVSKIYDSHQTLIFEISLTHPFETLILNDRRMYHEVSSFSTRKKLGFRRMMLIDFTRESYA